MQTEISRCRAKGAEMARPVHPGANARHAPHDETHRERHLRRVCLCLAKSRFPTAEAGVGGDLVRMLSQCD